MKHYRGDTGVFTDKLFYEACQDGSQTQSFSGVGTKNQDANAQRAIQTVIYMAISSIIPTSLHYSAAVAANLSFWSFAVEHAAWLYTRSQQHKSGISPLEFATTNMSDHHDLLRSHISGCPVYVLKVTLQDGKMLTTFFRPDCMGLFLGYLINVHC